MGRRDWLDDAPAYLAGGGAVETVTIETTNWARSPERHEGGTPNFVGAVALAEASMVLTELFGTGAVEAHETVLRRRLLAGLEPLDGVRALQIWPDTAETVGIVAFEVQGHEAGLVAACLSGEYAVGLRDGKFCAHPLLARLNCGQGALRASFGLGTTIDDIDRLIEALTQYLRKGPVIATRAMNGGSFLKMTSASHRSPRSTWQTLACRPPPSVVEDPFGEQEAAIRPRLARGHDGKNLLGAGVEILSSQ